MEALTNVQFLRGQERGQDKSPEGGLFGGATKNKSIHKKTGKRCFQKQMTFGAVLHGPCDPHEHMLKDVSSNDEQKNRFVNRRINVHFK